MTKLDESGQVIYLQYKNLEDMLKVILFSAQSALGLTPMLYSIKHNNSSILFIQTGLANGAVIHYLIMRSAKPEQKYIELKRLTGEFKFVENIGTRYNVSVYSSPRIGNVHTQISPMSSLYYFLILGI